MTETAKERKNRTNRQNKYLWSCVYDTIAKALAANGVRCKSGRITEEDVHEWAKEHILEPLIVEEDVALNYDGVVTDRNAVLGMFGLRRRPSTSSLTTEKFQKYILALQAHFAEFGIYIPDPNEEQMMGCYGKKVPLDDYSEETA